MSQVVTLTKVGAQNILKKMDSCFRRNVVDGLLQEARTGRDYRDRLTIPNMAFDSSLHPRR